MYEDENNYFVGAFEGEKIVGLASVQVSRPNHPWLCRNGGFGISILESHQGQGLGTYLMSKLENWAREKSLHRIFGTVRNKNTKAIGLYLKCGFEIEGLSRETAFIKGQWHDEYHIAKILR